MLLAIRCADELVSYVDFSAGKVQICHGKAGELADPQAGVEEDDQLVPITTIMGIFGYKGE